MFIISEISPQFGSDLNVAEQMILQSKMHGASAVKLQLYPTEMFFPDTVDPYVKARELTFDNFQRLFDYGQRIGIPVFATAFDEERLQWCKRVGQRYFKIAARQHSEQPALVQEILDLQQPTFVSLSADTNYDDMVIHDHCTYLLCVGRYPTLLEDVQLVDFSQSYFSGLSDHSLGVAAALMSAAWGATHLEKHFTVSHTWQRSNEQGHLGAMDAQQLELIAQVAGDMRRIEIGQQ